MRYLKMIGLAVVAAMAAMAFAGASSASATILCATTPVNNDCSIGWDYPAGTPLDFSVIGSAVFEDTSGKLIHTCNAGTFKGTSSNTGSGTETVSANVVEWSWTSCTATVSTVKLGTIELHAQDDHSAILTGKNNQWTTNTTAFGSCIYGTSESGTSLGTISAGEEGTANINAVLNKVSGSFICPATIKWTVTMRVTAPRPLYFATTMG
jgi:hypothetical protein